jgi:hypothetical protein
MLTGLAVHRTGRYVEIIWAGVIMLTLGNGLYILFDVNASIGKIVGFELVEGIGAGMLFGPPLIALQASTAQEDVATATATLGLARNLANSLSVIIGGVIFQNGMQKQIPKLRAAGLSKDVIQKLSGDGAAANVDLISTIADAAQKLAVKKAYAWALKNLWILSTCMAACAALASVFISKQVLSKVYVEARTGLEKDEPLVVAEHELSTRS